jgi:hypothetical protein
MTLALPLPASGQAPPISAADKETARNLLDVGDTAYAAGDYAKALESYRQADAIMGVPTTTLPLGRAYEGMGKLVEARDAYLRVIRFAGASNNAFASASTEADERAQKLQTRIATLDITVSGAGESVVDIAIDGEPVSAASVRKRSVNPGEHTVSVTAVGYKSVSQTVTLGEGESKNMSLMLDKDPNAVVTPPSPDEPKRPAEPSDEGTSDDGGGGFPVWATVGFAVGAVGIGVGAATGILSLGKESDLADQCNDDKQCAPDAVSIQDDGILLANISNVGFIVGGLGIAFGVVALFTLDADDDSERAYVQPIVGPGWVGVRGAF